MFMDCDWARMTNLWVVSSVDCTLTAGPTEHGLALYSDAAAAAVLFAQCLSEFVLNRPLKTHVRMERESDNDNRKLVQTVQQQRLVAISLWIQIGHVTIFCLMLTTACCRTRFSVWLVCGYAHVRSTVVSFDRRTFPRSLFHVRYTRLGDRAFPVAGPRLWNSIPSKLRQSDLTLHQFCPTLKTYSFGWLRLQHLVTFVLSVLYRCSYLLTYCIYTTFRRHCHSPIQITHLHKTEKGGHKKVMHLP